MFRKILLLICVAFVVVCYAYPCFVLPFGSYTGTMGDGDSKVEVSMTFGFDGKVKTKIGDHSQEEYYKISGNSIIISSDKTFDDNDVEIKLDSMYNFALSEGILELEVQNNIGFYMTIGVGILAIVLIVLPNKRR